MSMHALNENKQEQPRSDMDFFSLIELLGQHGGNLGSRPSKSDVDKRVEALITEVQTRLHAIALRRPAKSTDATTWEEFKKDIAKHNLPKDRTQTKMSAMPMVWAQFLLKLYNNCKKNTELRNDLFAILQTLVDGLARLNFKLMVHDAMTGLNTVIIDQLQNEKDLLTHELKKTAHKQKATQDAFDELKKTAQQERESRIKFEVETQAASKQIAELKQQLAEATQKLAEKDSALAIATAKTSLTLGTSNSAFFRIKPENDENKSDSLESAVTAITSKIKKKANFKPAAPISLTTCALQFNELVQHYFSPPRVLILNAVLRQMGVIATNEDEAKTDKPDPSAQVDSKDKHPLFPCYQILLLRSPDREGKPFELSRILSKIERNDLTLYNKICSDLAKQQLTNIDSFVEPSVELSPANRQKFGSGYDFTASSAEALSKNNLNKLIKLYQLLALLSDPHKNQKNSTNPFSGKPSILLADPDIYNACAHRTNTLLAHYKTHFAQKPRVQKPAVHPSTIGEETSEVSSGFHSLKS